MDNNHIDFYTNGIQRGRWFNTGNLLIGDGPDAGFKLQLHDRGSIAFKPTLSRLNDLIMFGGYLNADDGQNMIISTYNDATSHAVLMERDGNIGMGWGSPSGYIVGHPTLRINADGVVSVASTRFYFGQTGGPYNSSALVTSVSNGNEWADGYEYPNGANYYYFGTVLQGATEGNTRAPLKIGAKTLSFNTGATDIEAVRITDAQNVIIGPGNDNDNMLQLNGNFFQGYTATASFGNGLLFNRNNNMSRIYSESEIVYQSNSAGDQHVFSNAIGAAFTGTMVTLDPGYYQNLPDNQLSLKVYGRQYIPGLSVNMIGHVGIGNLAPTAQLHVTGSVRFDGLIKNNNLTRIVVSDANGNLYYKEDSSSSAYNNFYNSDLAVNGTVSAQKMIISQTGRWPDYVFSKQYRLPSLMEVENYIKQNSHLPGIPAAAEVAKKGMDVANNQAALLKKIEELTLYIIEQEKTIQKQNDQISDLLSLKQEMAELKALIKNNNQPVK
jgi:hypothetical protein